MPLAGRMKLKHFVMLAVGGGAVILGGIVVVPMVLGALLWPQHETPPPAVAAAPAAPAAVAQSGRRPVDQLIFEHLGRDLRASKKKDAAPGQTYKVNLYQDDGEGSVNRVKVDLDRDEQWDEKWTIEGELITRHVAPADDEQYTASYVWTGSDWRIEGAASKAPASKAPASEAPASEAPASEAPEMRAVDEVIFGYVGQDLGTKKRKDVTAGRPYKVNLYQDDGNSTVNRAKVDLDRDEQWDEKWTIDGQSVSRKVSPADDGQYTEVSTWSGSGWQ